MGGTGSYSYSLDHPNDVPEGMEAGTLNTVGIVALRHGIEWTNRHFDRINAKINAVFSHIKEGFENIDGLNIIAANNGIILANVKKIDPTDFASLLNENGIYVREGLHCAPLMHKKLGTNLFGAVRFSVGFNNDLSDAERTVEVVKGICHKAMG